MKTFTTVLTILSLTGAPIHAQMMPIRPIVITRPSPVIVKPQHKNIVFRGISRQPQLRVQDFLTQNNFSTALELNDFSSTTQQKFILLLNDVKAHANTSHREFLQNFLAAAASESAHLDIDAMVAALLQAAAAQESADLGALLDEMKQNTQRKKDLREQLAKYKQLQSTCLRRPCPVLNGQDLLKIISADQSQLDTLNDLGQLLQIRLQEGLDRMQKAAEMLSNLMKQLSDTSADIIENLK